MKIKTEKGITVVSLIITVVILLILSIVAISSLKNDGIFGYAQNATSQFEEGQRNEQGVLNGYVDSLNNINVEKEEPVKTISFEIILGSFSNVNNLGTYIAEEGMTWREWCASSYNNLNAYVTDTGIRYTYEYELAINPDEVIVSGEEYTFELHLARRYLVIRRKIHL